MNTDKKAVTGSLVANEHDENCEVCFSPTFQAQDQREMLREKQDRVIEICESRGLDMETPISDLQYGAPTARELKVAIYPNFEASINSFLQSFDI